jgi:hypothetical protein
VGIVASIFHELSASENGTWKGLHRKSPRQIARTGCLFSSCRMRPAPVLAFALDAARRFAPGLHFGYAIKVPFGGAGVVQWLVLGLLAMPERRRLPALHRGEGYRPCSFSSWPATGKPRSYSPFSSAMRRCFAASSRCDAPPGELLLPWRMQASVLFGSETQMQ